MCEESLVVEYSLEDTNEEAKGPSVMQSQVHLSLHEGSRTYHEYMLLFALCHNLSSLMHITIVDKLMGNLITC